MASNVQESNAQRGYEMYKEDLECPVCLDLPESFPIYQCMQGHILCNTCFSKLDDCPVCRVELILPIRALTEEKMLRRILKVCKHQGCSKRKLTTELEEHEDTCEFGPKEAAQKVTRPIVKRKKTRRRPKRYFSSWPIG